MRRSSPPSVKLRPVRGVLYIHTKVSLGLYNYIYSSIAKTANKIACRQCAINSALTQHHLKKQVRKKTAKHDFMEPILGERASR